jgi:PAS domain S-box-containing protein
MTFNFPEKPGQGTGRSLSRRFSYTLTLVVMTILLIFSACSFLYSYLKIDNELKAQLDQTVRFAETSLPTAIWQLNYSSMNDVLSAILINDAIASVRILAEGEVVAAKTSDAYADKKFSFFEQSKQFLVKRVDIYSAGENAGMFEVAISRQEIRQGLILTITGVIVLASLLFVAILCTTLFLTRKYVFKPLVRLEFSARRIAEGDLDTTIDTDSGDEIAQLAQAFNTMAHKLKISFATLEHKVNERTADLIDAKIEAEKINQDLRSAGAQLQALLNNYPVGILFVGYDRVIKRVNAEMTRISGYSWDELEGGTTRKFYPSQESYEENGRRNYPNLRRNGVCELQNDLLRKDGTSVPCYWRARIIETAEGLEGVVWSVEDISHRLRLEEELLKIKKLESVAVLAGGIAHDFNNILVAIIGNVSLAERLVEEKHQARELLVRAISASLRAKNLVLRLLAFASGGEPIRGSASLPELLRESVPFVLAGSNVKCEYDIPAALWSINMDRGQLDQVFQNLVLNADQSMPDGGTMTISCANVEEAADEIPGLRPGRYVRVEVCDSGHGIRSEHIDRIFDPYFSTKEKDSNKGSGLGLSIVHSIITRHQGRITVQAVPDRGSIFTLYLPALAEEGVEEKRPQEVIIKGRGRVMIMDDEEIVRRVVCDMLSYLGYEGIEARDGHEALSLYERSLRQGQRIDAVIMDLTIPGGMGGKEAIQRLLVIDPQARTIVSSGYFDAPVMYDFRNDGFSDIVSKPYQLLDLSKVLAAVLSPPMTPEAGEKN